MMRLTSPEFEDGARIPQRFTCEGDDVSPPLVIDGIPDGAQSIALIVDDADAPRGSFDHWLIWNVPARLSTLPEAIPTERIVPGLGPAAQGRNDFGEIGYRGPCPPRGREHTYRFRVYAVDGVIHLDPGADRDALERALEGHILAEAELTGRYGRE